MSFLLVGIFLTLLATCPAFQRLGSRSTDSTTALLSAIMANFSTTWTTGLALSRLAFHRCYFHNYPLDLVPALQSFSVPFVLSCLRNSIVFLQIWVGMFRPPFVSLNKYLGAHSPLCFQIPLLSVCRFLSSVTSQIRCLTFATVSGVNKLKQHVDKLLATVYDSWCLIATTEKLSSGVNKLKQHVDKLYASNCLWQLVLYSDNRKTIFLHENLQWTDAHFNGNHSHGTF